MPTVKELRELRAKLVSDAEALIPADGKITAEIRTKVEAMFADAKTQADMISFLEAEERSAAEQRGRSLQLPNVGENSGVDEKAAFRNYLAKGETRDLTVAADGVLIPQLVAQPVVAKKSAGFIYGVVGRMTTATGAPVKVPTLNDTANTWVLNSTAPATNDPAVAEVDLNVDAYRANPILVDNFLVQDTAYDLDGFVVKSFFDRYLRDVSKAITLGNSSNITGYTSIAQGMTSGTTGKVGWNDFSALVGALDPAYAADACFTMSNATLGAVLQIVDSNGRPLFVNWDQGTQDGFIGKILGYPVKINQYQPAIATGAVAVSFGSFSEGYQLREVAPGVQIKRLAERYAELNKVGYVGFMRIGGAPTDAGTHPILNLTIK